MGWSATHKACCVMDEWTKTCRSQGGTQNGFTHGGRFYFWEHGRERADGGITGSLYRADGIRVGGWHIDPDGVVLRCPAVMAAALGITTGRAIQDA